MHQRKTYNTHPYSDLDSEKKNAIAGFIEIANAFKNNSNSFSIFFRSKDNPLYHIIRNYLIENKLKKTSRGLNLDEYNDYLARFELVIDYKGHSHKYLIGIKNQILYVTLDSKNKNVIKNYTGQKIEILEKEQKYKHRKVRTVTTIGKILTTSSKVNLGIDQSEYDNLKITNSALDQNQKNTLEEKALELEKLLENKKSEMSKELIQKQMVTLPHHKLENLSKILEQQNLLLIKNKNINNHELDDSLLTASLDENDNQTTTSSSNFSSIIDQLIITVDQQDSSTKNTDTVLALSKKRKLEKPYNVSKTLVNYKGLFFRSEDDLNWYKNEIELTEPEKQNNRNKEKRDIRCTYGAKK